MTREQAIERFLALQHAGFTRHAANLLAGEAEREGTSRDCGNGHALACTPHGWAVQVRGKWYYNVGGGKAFSSG